MCIRDRSQASVPLIHSQGLRPSSHHEAYGALPSDHSGNKESIALRGLGQMRLLWPSRRSEVESMFIFTQQQQRRERRRVRGGPRATDFASSKQNRDEKASISHALVAAITAYTPNPPPLFPAHLFNGLLTIKT